MDTEEQKKFILKTICRVVEEKFKKTKKIKYYAACLPSSQTFYEVAQKFNISSRLVYGT